MFFTAINQVMTEGVDLTIVIRKANGQMAVSTLPKSNGLKDEAQNHIVPLTLSGLPEELDAGFIGTISKPIQKVSGLLTNMAQFEKQADKAAADSKVAKEAKAKETKEEKEKREKYEKHLKKAEELIAAGNHKDAVTALGQARLYTKPQDLKKIDGMVEEQKKAMNKGSLFEMMDEQPAPQPQQARQAAQPVAGQQPMVQPQAGQMPPQPQPRRYVQQPVQQPAPQTVQQPYHGRQMMPGQQPAYHHPSQPQMPLQQPYPYPQQGACPQAAQGVQHPHYGEPVIPPYPESQDMREDAPYPPQDEPAYRPEDYEEYPDFPQSMLDPKYSPYQTV